MCGETNFHLHLGSLHNTFWENLPRNFPNNVFCLIYKTLTPWILHIISYLPSNHLCIPCSNPLVAFSLDIITCEKSQVCWSVSFVCLFVCLSVSAVAPTVFNQCSWKFKHCSALIKSRASSILVYVGQRSRSQSPFWWFLKIDRNFVNIDSKKFLKMSKNSSEQAQTFFATTLISNSNG